MNTLINFSTKAQQLEAQGSLMLLAFFLFIVPGMLLWLNNIAGGPFPRTKFGTAYAWSIFGLVILSFVLFIARTILVALGVI